MVQKAWRLVAPMLTARNLFGAVSSHNIILVAGGATAGATLLNSVEAFTPPAVGDSKDLGQWTTIQPMKSAMAVGSGLVWNGDIFLFGESYVYCKRLTMLHFKHTYVNK